MKIFGFRTPLWMFVAGLLAIAFGLLTVKSGASVLFGSEEARRAAGSYLPSLVWFNLLAGFAYVLAGAGLWFQRRWAGLLATGIAMATALAFGAFGLHVWEGGTYEIRTVWAMLLRLVLWSAIALFACRALGCPARGQAH